MKTMVERFWDRVKKTESCWLWTGMVNRSGYGIFTPSKNYRRLAHRVVWVLTNGPIPDGLFVCHHCDVRNCIRPDHLFLGTQRDNIVDASRKGRMPGNPNPCSPEAKKKIGTWFRTHPGHPCSEETKHRLSEKARGRRRGPVSEETRRKLREIGLTRDVSFLHTPESRIKAAAKLRGRIQSPEQRAKAAEALRKSLARRREIANA